MKLRKTMVVAALLLVSSLTHAATIFSDNFDAYLPDQLNWLPPAASGWVVTDGTVDLHGAGGSYDVLPGHGSYVDSRRQQPGQRPVFGKSQPDWRGNLQAFLRARRKPAWKQG